MTISIHGRELERETEKRFEVEQTKEKVSAKEEENYLDRERDITETRE